MRPVSSPNADTLGFKGGGGCLTLFGLPFLAAGIGIITAAIATKDGPPLAIGIPFGLVFATVGAGISLGRCGMRIDRARNTIDRWWGLVGFPLKRSSTPLGDVEAITITREVRRSDKSTYTVYPVRLVGGSASVKVDEPRDAAKARTAAEQLAEFLEMPIRDSSSGTEHVRQADEINMSLRDRAREKGLQIEMPETPPQIASKVDIQGQEVTFDLPKPGFQPLMLIPLIGVGFFITIAVSVFLLPMLSQAMKGETPLFIFVGFVAVFFVILPLATVLPLVLRGANMRTRVSANPRQLSVTTRFVGQRTRTIRADELEELFVGGPTESRKMSALLGRGNTITARSDKLTLTFGGHLSTEEADYICAVLQRVLTA